mgnify:CR=1 FL=1
MPHTVNIPHFKRAAKTSRRCIFNGCDNAERFIVPRHIKIFLGRELKFYVPSSARVCEYHLYSNEWELLSQNNDSLCDFTGRQAANVISLSVEQTSQ